MILVYYEGGIYILIPCKVSNVQVLNSIQLLVNGKTDYHIETEISVLFSYLWQILVENDQLATSSCFVLLVFFDM